MKLQIKQFKGLTLIELLVAIALFSTISLLALNVFVNVTRMQGRIALENAIYEDARFMMERVARSIRNNTIDYEEYFNKAMNSGNQYGDLYGCYAAQFYNPGLGDSIDLNKDPGALGAFCNDRTPYTGQECVVYKPSIDFNTGLFPYEGASPFLPSTAFCPAALGTGCTTAWYQTNQTKELYLIDKDGKNKTIFALKKITDLGSGKFENALSTIRLAGKDLDNDGIVEKWRNCSGNNSFCCANGFDCPAGAGPTDTLEKTLNASGNTNKYQGFVPISPLRTNVTNLTFTITPAEDPRKAFAEGIGNSSQPMVKISLTVQPSKDQLIKYGNPDAADIPNITLQTVVSTRIQTEVKSYLGGSTYQIGNGLTPPPVSANQGVGLGYCKLI